MISPQTLERYQTFLSSPSAQAWKRFGLQKRSGVAAPLFSLYSKQSTGIGEIPDLKMLMNWCVSTGMSLIELLPMNDVGFDFRPYDAQSTFALEPMYLSLDQLPDVDLKPFKSKIDDLRRRFPAGTPQVNYGIKKGKLNLLRQIFDRQKERKKKPQEKSFSDFMNQNNFWLEDYSLFKVLKENLDQSGWESWPDEFRGRNPAALQAFKQSHGPDIEFQKWLQWQLFEQFRSVKQEANSKKIYLMGDLPFLVSRDSADVWSHQDYFKLHLSSGAPPDMYFASGQRWGMPPYNWPAIESHGYDYLIQKLKYAENFYDLFRIDHVVGVFRVWTIALTEPQESGGLHGVFDPPDEKVWEEHGRKILKVMVENTAMLPCAEDLGTVPPCSYRVLEEFGIPGMEIQRWAKDWGKTYDFTKPEAYRHNSVAMLSTHDSSSFNGWWEFEAGTVDAALFKRKCESRGITFEDTKNSLFDPEKSFHGRLRWREEIDSVQKLVMILKRPEHEIADLIDLYLGSWHEKNKFWKFLELPGPFKEKSSLQLVKKALLKASQTASIFSVQLLQDWLSLDPSFAVDSWQFRINVPGSMDERNWSARIPKSLEEMKKLSINHEIRTINTQANRHSEAEGRRI
ncbi:MAG: 4-alpha-glucanotransferase [Candidatus Omnitrophica bacterium]|nr:4-alpha-glucanotransferase [Candidatus Omnitrophota bacterium]